jgi:hypothetical protein
VHAVAILIHFSLVYTQTLPTLPLCMTAALCVRLGNQYGQPWAAQAAANEVLDSISDERWLYYLDDRLERDLVILPRLSSPGRPLQEWMSLAGSKSLDPEQLTGKNVKLLLSATNNGNSSRVVELARSLYQSAA